MLQIFFVCFFFPLHHLAFKIKYLQHFQFLSGSSPFVMQRLQLFNYVFETPLPAVGGTIQNQIES